MLQGLQAAMAVLHLLLLLPLISAESLSGRPDREGKLVWSNQGMFGKYDVTVYEPTRSSSDWYMIGQRAQGNYNVLSTPIYAIKDNTNRSMIVRPEGFALIWDDRGSTAFNDGSAWKALCPREYVAVGHFFININRRDKAPEELFNKVRCVHQSLTEPCADWGKKVWETDGNPLAEYKASIWEVKPQPKSGFEGGFLFVNADTNGPPEAPPACLKLSAIKYPV